MKDKLTLFPEDSRVSPTRLQGKEKEQKMTGISGQKCLEQYEKLNPNGLLAKMFMDLLIGTGDWFSKKSTLTWKLKGTKYGRLYFQLFPKTRHIEEIEFGLLPTPMQRDWKGAQGMGYKGISDDLPTKAMKGLLPTPTTRDWKGARTKEALQEAGRNATNSLPDAFSQAGKTSQLNPRFVAEMMGFPPNWTELPFQNGETKASKDTEMP